MLIEGLEHEVLALVLALGAVSECTVLWYWMEGRASWTEMSDDALRFT
jgi:hypothetical protein